MICLTLCVCVCVCVCECRLGVALHNIASKSKDAIATFKSILELDTGDHLVSE